MSFKAAFIDRDGVINEDYGYVYSWENFRFKKNLKKGLLILQNLGYKLIIITNQSGIGRGYYSDSDYKKLTIRYLSELRKCKITIDAVYHCPHDPTKFDKHTFCNCRKPNPGLIIEAIRSFNIDPKKSIIIGDKISDIQAGVRGGIQQRYLINKSHKPDDLISHTFKSLFDCAQYISNIEKEMILL